MEIKPAMVAIAAFVVITVVAAVLMPVLNDATETERTFTNEGIFNMGIFEPSDTYVMTVDVATGAITVNGDAIPSMSVTSSGYSILSSENLLLRFGSSGSGYYLNIIGVDSGGTSITGSGSCTATVSGSTIVVDFKTAGGSDVTKTFNFTQLYSIVKDESDAVMKYSTSSVFIKGDSEVYATGLTNVSNWANAFHFEGTYDDGITISSPNLTTATFDNITWNIEPVAGYDDLYKLTSIEFDITDSGTTVHATYSYFGVPSEVTADKSVQLTSNESAMLMVIPALLIVAIIIGVLAVAMRGRE